MKKPTLRRIQNCFDLLEKLSVTLFPRYKIMRDVEAMPLSDEDKKSLLREKLYERKDDALACSLEMSENSFSKVKEQFIQVFYQHIELSEEFCRENWYTFDLRYEISQESKKRKTKMENDDV